MPPRPSSSHSQQGIPSVPGQQQQLNQGLNQGAPLEGQMTSPGPQNSGPPPMQGYPGQPSPHMQQQQHGGYKMGPYPPQSQYSQGNYSPRAQYPGYGNQQGPPNSPGQYRPMHNHVGPPGGPHSGHPGQYPPHPGYPQVWPPGPPQNNPGAMSNHIQGKNIGPPLPQSPQGQQQQQQPQQPPQQQQQQPQQPGGPGGSPRQLNYLKQHLQHKGGYSQGSTPPPQGYGNGPGIHPPMGPPSHHMGPPTGPPSSMGPPPASTGTPPSHMENPGMQQMPPNIHHPEGMPPQDNGMPPTSHQVTSLITTGPDGAAIDEASQQSTVSNTSIGKRKL
jgi:AT-rich interactive domain-containing protein 1